jgi:hypothetical protein
MLIEYADGRVEIVDFVVPSVEDARKAIADGAVNGRDLLEEAGLSPADAEAELKRIEAAE